MDGGTKRKTPSGNCRHCCHPAAAASPWSPTLTGPPTKRRGQKRRLEHATKAPTPRREEQNSSTTQSSGSETGTSSALSTSASSWDEPPPKRAGRHRPAHRREAAAAFPRRPAKHVPGSHQQHRDTASRHRGGGSRSTAEEAVRILAEAASGKAYRRKRSIPHKYLFPYDLVERGDEGKALKKGEATRRSTSWVLSAWRLNSGSLPTPSLRCQGTRKRSPRITARCLGRPSGAIPKKLSHR